MSFSRSRVRLSPAALQAFIFWPGLIGLAAGFTLFALGYIGGGDAKLFAGIALWLGLHDLLAYTLVAAMLGGFLTLALLALRQLPLPAGLARQGWLLKLHDQGAGIPYGVALAAGVFVILPQAEMLPSRRCRVDSILNKR